MNDRIKLILKEKGYSSSTFADKIQVSRGTISHILNGRNNPNKDTIDKILNAFPEISKAWFISGEGPMYIREQSSIKLTSSSEQPDLFDEGNSVVNSSVKPQEHENPLKNEDNKPEETTVSPAIQGINFSNNISKKIDKIIIFFNDKTFMTFISED